MEGQHAPLTTEPLMTVFHFFFFFLAENNPERVRGTLHFSGDTHITFCWYSEQWCRACRSEGVTSEPCFGALAAHGTGVAGAHMVLSELPVSVKSIPTICPLSSNHAEVLSVLCLLANRDFLFVASRRRKWTRKDQGCRLLFPYFLPLDFPELWASWSLYSEADTCSPLRPVVLTHSVSANGLSHSHCAPSLTEPPQCGCNTVLSN